jgi:hypothetical protein
MLRIVVSASHTTDDITSGILASIAFLTINEQPAGEQLMLTIFEVSFFKGRILPLYEMGFGHDFPSQIPPFPRHEMHNIFFRVLSARIGCGLQASYDSVFRGGRVGPQYSRGLRSSSDDPV